MKHKATKRNFKKVLTAIGENFDKHKPEQKKAWVDWLNESLNNLLADDFFGTEGQCDPRGDQRD